MPVYFFIIYQMLRKLRVGTQAWDVKFSDTLWLSDPDVGLRLERQSVGRTLCKPTLRCLFNPERLKLGHTGVKVSDVEAHLADARLPTAVGGLGAAISVAQGR